MQSLVLSRDFFFKTHIKIEFPIWLSTLLEKQTIKMKIAADDASRFQDWKKMLSKKIMYF